MRIDQLNLRNFRCFQSITLDLNGSCIFITGKNGAGKTSILEALHYSCYLKSFKTHIPKELVNFTQNQFSINLSVYDNLTGKDDINIGFSDSKKSIKVNDKTISSYKDLLNIYKIITMIEDDLLLIQGYPSIRRSFIDQAIMLYEPSYISLLRSYRITLENRNALILSKKDSDSYVLWTDQLLKLTHEIQQKRVLFLSSLEENLKHIISLIDTQIDQIKLNYIYSKPYNIQYCFSAPEIINNYPNLKDNEFMQKRSLFGAHLDDISIIYQNKLSRNFASRGQQKLIVFLLKCAQMNFMSNLMTSASPILLIDDFITDLDKERINLLIPLIKQFSSQVIITSPLEDGVLANAIKDNSKIILLP